MLKKLRVQFSYFGFSKQGAEGCVFICKVHIRTPGAFLRSGGKQTIERLAESVPVGSAAGCFGEGAFFSLSVLIREEAPRPLCCLLGLQ